MKNPRAARPTAWLLGGWLAAIVCLPSIAPGQTVWEWEPYRVVVVVVDPAGVLPLTSPETVAVDLVQKCETFLGGMWNVRHSDPTAMLRRLLMAPDAPLSAEDLAPDWLQHDKVFIVGLYDAGEEYHATARDFDVRTRTASPVVVRSVGHVAKLPDAAFAAILEAFAPLARLETVENRDVTLRLRAAALPPRDGTIAHVAPGSLFQCLVRYDDRDGNPRRIAAVPWTVLQVEAGAGAEWVCRLHTGIRSPLSARRRGRVEQLALAIIRPPRPTVLRLVARTEPHDPLVAYHIFWSSPGETPAKLLGLTDRDGAIRVPYDPAIPLRNVVIKSGRQLLARLPIVPGYETHIDLPLSPDDVRLAAETRLASLHEELLDLATERQILLARIRALLAKGEPEEARSVLRRLTALKSQAGFLQDLTQEQNALLIDDPAVQQRIRAMFDRTRRQVFEYIDPREVDRATTAVTEALAHDS